MEGNAVCSYYAAVSSRADGFVNDFPECKWIRQRTNPEDFVDRSGTNTSQNH
jgi:hypothetical protein